jgi:Fe-S-cluster-containing hydrogenase component 2
MKKLIINAYKCWGCKTCMETCRRTFGGEAPRINVIVRDKNARIPLTCLHCGDPACEAACKFGASARNETTGAIEIDRERCTTCKACLEACPYGNIIWEKKTERTVKCNLCGGSPECAKTCPSGTLMFE